MLLNTTNSTEYEIPLLSIRSRLHLTLNAIVLSVIGLAIVLINVLAVVAFIKHLEVTTKFGVILVFSLCISCLLSAVVLIPVILIDIYYEGRSVTSFVYSYLLYLSVLHLLVTCRERCLVLYKPFKYIASVEDETRSRNILLFIWLSPMVPTLLPLSWWFSTDDNFTKAHFIYFVVSSVIWILLSTAVNVSYILLLIMSEKGCSDVVMNSLSKSEAHKRRQRKKGLRLTYLLLIISFIIIFIPNIYINLFHMFRAYNYVPEYLELYGIYTYVLNSIITPVMFLYMKQNYSDAVKHTLRLLLNALSTKKRNNPTSDFEMKQRVPHL